MNDRDATEVVQFLTESGMLKRVVRSGWTVAGVPNPESVADHSFRSALVAFCLAVMEDEPWPEAMAMALMNDLPETRLGDLHKIAQQYLPSGTAEPEAFHDQTASLPDKLRPALTALYQEYRDQQTAASQIARDADLLECLLQAREYEEQGHVEAKEFQRRAPALLTTDSAKQLWAAAEGMAVTDWWKSLGTFKHEP